MTVESFLIIASYCLLIGTVILIIFSNDKQSK